MKGQALLIINLDFVWVLHKHPANISYFRLECGRIHHDLLLVWSALEYVLNVSPHIECLKHLITLIQDKVLHVFHFQVFSLN